MLLQTNGCRKSNNLLYQSQYGFRKDHSTELASTELKDGICKVMDKGEIPFSIFLNLFKDFDMRDHEVFLTKLRHYGIVGTPLIWFKSSLTNRAQYVEMNGTCSNLSSIGKGVPQGSNLGPLLFIIFIMTYIDSARNLNSLHMPMIRLSLVRYPHSLLILTEAWQMHLKL